MCFIASDETPPSADESIDCQNVLPRRSSPPSHNAPAISPPISVYSNPFWMLRFQIPLWSKLTTWSMPPAKHAHAGERSATVSHARRWRIGLKFIVDTRRNTLQSSAREAMRSVVADSPGRRIECGKRTRIVAVRGDAMASRAEIVVGVVMIDRHHPVRIESGVLVERMSPSGRMHIGFIVWVRAAG